MNDEKRTLTPRPKARGLESKVRTKLGWGGGGGDGEESLNSLMTEHSDHQEFITRRVLHHFEVAGRNLILIKQDNQTKKLLQSWKEDWF